jgi:hypothetical protein
VKWNVMDTVTLKMNKVYNCLSSGSKLSYRKLVYHLCGVFQERNCRVNGEMTVLHTQI